MKSIKYMLSKASFSSLTGWPIAFAANIAILPLFVDMLQEDLLMAGILIGVVFGVISIIRLFIIDYVEDRYGLNIKPDHLIKKLFKK
jgi:uncharacterized membrane protein